VAGPEQACQEGLPNYKQILYNYCSSSSGKYCSEGSDIQLAYLIANEAEGIRRKFVVNKFDLFYNLYVFFMFIYGSLLCINSMCCIPCGIIYIYTSIVTNYCS
jgi:hypothetical protein